MLYLVRFDNALKIGYTSNLINRLNNFKTTQLNVELISSREGNVKHEKILHELCASSKLRNELFKDDPIVISIFNNHIFNDNEIEIKNLEIENKKLMIENQTFKLKNKTLVKENEKLMDDLKSITSKVNIIEDKLNIVNQEKELKYTFEESMFIDKDTLVTTNDCFNYEKKYQHKGNDNIIVKYSNNIIDMAQGKLYYDIKKKEVLTKFFYPAKSYPEGNNSIKYYYYDTDCNIKYEDIMNIKAIVVNNFCNQNP